MDPPSPQKYKKERSISEILLGQGTWLQSSCLVRFAKHGLPPLKGVGLLQGKCLKVVPLSQDLLQMLHGADSSSPPSTFEMRKNLLTVSIMALQTFLLGKGSGKTRESSKAP